VLSEINRHFSIKSAYRFCTQELIDTSHLSRPGLWHLIWNLHTLLKVKNLMWRVCRICLPTRVKLRTRGVNRPHSCVFCDAESEDNIHLFFCARTVAVYGDRAGFLLRCLQLLTLVPMLLV
jgi:hypothetical protein